MANSKGIFRRGSIKGFFDIDIQGIELFENESNGTDIYHMFGRNQGWGSRGGPLVDSKRHKCTLLTLISGQLRILCRIL